MKKTILQLTFFIILISLFGVLSHAETYGDLTYKVVDGEVTITDCISTVTEVTIPSEIDGYPVTKIGYAAFKNHDYITSVSFSDNITEIESWAFFGCDNLKTISELPEGLIKIGQQAFEACKKLTGILVNENNQVFSSDEYGVLFDKNKTALITYPAGSFCKSYTIPKGVTKLGYWLEEKWIASSLPFQSAQNLTTVFIPETLSFMEPNSFNACSKLQAIWVEENNNVYSSDNNGILYNKQKNTLIKYPAASSCVEYVLPNTVNWISDYAFSNNTNELILVILNNRDSYSRYVSHYAFDQMRCRDVTIYGYKGTVAEEIAKQQGFDFVSISSSIFFQGASLLLDGTIGLKTYFEYDSTLIDPDTLAVTATVKNSDNGSNTVSTLPVILEEDGKTAYAVVYVSPKDADNITVDCKVTASLLVGGTTELEISSISIPSYIEDFKTLAETNEEYAKALDLVTALETYCKYADDYFNNEESILGDLDVTPDFSKVSSPAKVGEIDGVNIYATSLILKGSTTLRYYFTVEDESLLEALTARCEGADVVFDSKNLKSGLLYIDVTDIPAHELGNSFTLTLTRGEENLSVTYSPMNYVKDVCDRGEGRHLNLSKALYSYYTEAASYIAPEEELPDLEIIPDENETEIDKW